MRSKGSVAKVFLLVLTLALSGCSNNRPELNGFEQVDLVKGCHYLDELFWDFETGDKANNLFEYVVGAQESLIGFSDFEIGKNSSELRSLWEKFEEIDFESAIVEVYDTYREQEINVRGPGYKYIQKELQELRFDCNMAIQNYITHRSSR